MRVRVFVFREEVSVCVYTYIYIYIYVYSARVVSQCVCVCVCVDTRLSPRRPQVPGSRNRLLTIRLISAQNLPRPKHITPYVEILIVGVPVDCLSAQTQFLRHEGPFLSGLVHVFHGLT